MVMIVETTELLELLERVTAPAIGSAGRRISSLDAWNHAFVHLQKFKEGDTSEDHLGHLACNVAFPIWAVENGLTSMRWLPLEFKQ